MDFQTWTGKKQTEDRKILLLIDGISLWADRIKIHKYTKGPVLKSFMRQVAIIEYYDVPRKFWIL